MKRHLLFIAIVFAAVLALHSQPVVNKNVLPAKPDRIVFYKANPSTSIDTGADIYWNFSNFGPIPSDSSVWEYQNVPTNITSLYSSATMAARVTESSSTDYLMYSFNTDQQNYWGSYYSFPIVKMQYSNAENLLRFPLKKSMSWSDAYALKHVNPGDSLNITGTVTVNVSGWGMIKLPDSKVYDTVLMVHAERLGTDHKGGKSRYETYEWYHPEYKAPIARLALSYYWTGSNWQMMIPNFYYQKTPEKLPSAGLKDVAAVAYIWPNPAQDKFTVQTQYPITEVVIYNAQGQLVLAQNAKGETQVAMATSELPEGFYTVQIRSNSGQFSNCMLNICR